MFMSATIAVRHVMLSLVTLNPVLNSRLHPLGETIGGTSPLAELRHQRHQPPNILKRAHLY